ncbi:universal stress protein [uncultured Microbacterium sp.]|uniref:universal stress protein n=1 Tax=uncultured Microbacterium sp. TaxID=191216 RepID=UPI0028D513C0|nr:universal stress protein [uncultured Microbacterium sp.]
MVETIVLGFDGSEASVIALDWVAERAARPRTAVEIVMIGGTLLEDDRDIGLLDAERRLLDRAPEAEVSSHRFPGRMPAALIERARNADLLVIGARRGMPLWSALSGWMPLRLTSGSGGPVVVVPDDWEPATGRVVVGVDDDRSSVEAVSFAAREADSAHVPLTLVHTWTMPTPRMEGAVVLLASPIEARAGERRILRDAAVAAQLTNSELVVEQILEQSSPASALLRAAFGASLVVVGTHHRGVIDGALLGSVGRDLLAECRTPVCVVPGADRAVR